MPQSPQFKEAGISILRYVYETCELHGVGTDEIVDLLAVLRDAVIIGQIPEKHPGQPILDRDDRRLHPALVTAIRHLRANGWTYAAIHKELGVTEATAAKYAPTRTIHVAETPPPVLPQSNGATDRRADDQEPPKV